MTEPRHPDVSVRLVGTDGNAFAILGTVRRALMAANVDADELAEFTADATSGDYDHLLQTVMRWVDVC
jgi:hypothetical protein